VKHHSTLTTTTLAIALGWSLLAAGPVAAQTAPTFPDVRGHYRGFSQSIGNPDARGPVELMIDSEDFTKGSFSGHLTMVTQEFTFAGKVEMDGRFKGRGNGVIGAVTFDGKMDGGGGAEVGGQDSVAGLGRFGYNFTAAGATRATDQGNGQLLRNFNPPPDQDRPPDINGAWAGVYRSDAFGGMGTVDLMVRQARDDVTGLLGTGFSGQEVVDRCTTRALMFDFVGTINSRGDTILVIGLGAAGQFLVGGMLQPPPDGDRVQFTYLLNFINQGIDLGTFGVMKTLPPGPC
jgi:hypothetical protein